MRTQINAEKAREILSYNQHTGVVTWRMAIADKCVVGKRAGSISSTGHRLIRIEKITYCEHRLIWLLMTGHWPEKQVDHINRNPADNRWKNLRLADHAQQSWNVGAHPRNTSGYKNVSYYKGARRWVAKIRHRGEDVSLGSFLSKEEAARAVRNAVSALRGEFDVR